MNPDTNRFEILEQLSALETVAQDQTDQDILRRIEQLQHSQLVRPNGEPVPDTWTKFQMGELVEIKGYTFRVAYIGETSILFEPVGVPVVGDGDVG